jgi:pyruvate dehydrogenase E2 component (dihydrolipoamide acetyltransferase)
MTRITMPQAGQSMEEGTILCWRKNEGELVNKGDILLEIETDKATVEVESSESGILRKILCPKGTIVPVHAPIAILGQAAEEINSEIAQAEAELQSVISGNVVSPETRIANETSPEPPAATPIFITPAVKATPVQALPAGQRPTVLRASPATRKAARERGIDLSTRMPGSGPGGRILLADLDRSFEPSSSVEPIRRPLVGMRRAIARSLVASKQSIPHFYMRMTFNAAPLVEFYRLQKAQYPCALNDLLILACARVMSEFPAFRSRIEGEELVEFPFAGIGIAVGMDDGLRVPVIIGAERLSLQQLAVESRRIIDAALQGRVAAMGQGLLTISNLGMFGVEEFSAIINPPEAAILAVGAIRETVIVSDGAIKAGRVMTMTLSADHRIIDGLLAARFLSRLKEILESPDSLRH